MSLHLVDSLEEALALKRWLGERREILAVDTESGGLDAWRDELRLVQLGAVRVFLADKPLFADKAAEFLEFLGEDQLVIHNAQFDIGFLNAELERAGHKKLSNPYIDTVSVARRKFPGQPASLDALCARFGIDNAHRTLHGALLDAELLSEVYVELVGGRQASMLLASDEPGNVASVLRIDRPPRPKREFAPTADELAAHAKLVASLKNPIWSRRCLQHRKGQYPQTCQVHRGRCLSRDQLLHSQIKDNSSL